MSGELCITIQIFPSESYILTNLVYPPTSPNKLSEAVGFWLYFWHPLFESRPWSRLSWVGRGGHVTFLSLSRKISSYTKLKHYWFSLNLPTLLFTIIYQFDTISSSPNVIKFTTDKQIFWVKHLCRFCGCNSKYLGSRVVINYYQHNWFIMLYREEAYIYPDLSLVCGISIWPTINYVAFLPEFLCIWTAWGWPIMWKFSRSSM